MSRADDRHSAKHRKPKKTSSKRKRKLLLRFAGGLAAAATAIFVGVTTNWLSSVNPFNHAAPAPGARPSPSPLPVPSSSTTSPHSPKNPGAGSAQSGGQSKPVGPPLKLLSELPIDPGDNLTWVFPERLNLSKPERADVDRMIRAGKYNSLYDFLFARRGYIISADTRFIIQNNRSYAILIKGIGVARKICQAPLTGSLIKAFRTPVHEPRNQLGVDLDLRHPTAVRAPSPDIRTWQPGYPSFPMVIDPGQSRTFDIRAFAPGRACSFWYVATVKDGRRIVTQWLGDEPFRVSAFSRPYMRAQGTPGWSPIAGYEDAYLIEGGRIRPVSGRTRLS